MKNPATVEEWRTEQAERIAAAKSAGIRSCPVWNYVGGMHCQQPNEHHGMHAAITYDAWELVHVEQRWTNAAEPPLEIPRPALSLEHNPSRRP